MNSNSFVRVRLSLDIDDIPPERIHMQNRVNFDGETLGNSMMKSAPLTLRFEAIQIPNSLSRPSSKHLRIFVWHITGFDCLRGAFYIIWNASEGDGEISVVSF